MDNFIVSRSMITYTDQAINLLVLEADRILVVEWLDTDHFQMSAFELSFYTLMQKIEKYKIKKLIWHANNTVINLPEEEFRSVVLLLQSGLAHAGIKKVARLFVDKSEKDLKCLAIFNEILSNMGLKIEVGNFDDQESAEAWIKK
jgi:hypothetical protein